MNRDREKEAFIPVRQPQWPNYSYLFEAAAAARLESRRHWAKGGEADTKHPTHRAKYWKIGETCRPHVSASSASPSTSASEPASGFSQITCLPALSAAVVCATCRPASCLPTSWSATATRSSCRRRSAST